MDLSLTLSHLRRGGGADPCARIGPDGIWRATWLPSGAVTMRLRSRSRTLVEVAAWGPGADEALATSPGLVGATDGDGGLTEADHPAVRDTARRLDGLRLCRNPNPIEALIPTIVEQKVQGVQAKRAIAAMARAFATPAPEADAAGAPQLLMPPTPEWLESRPPAAWHGWNIENKRATAIRVACSYRRRIAETVSMPPAAARDRLCALPGIGRWTANEVSLFAFGDPDAVSVGDYWLPHWICFNLAGEARGTDERMLELLAPWAGQRGRVCRLLELGGSAPPRFGPRLALHDIRSI